MTYFVSYVVVDKNGLSYGNVDMRTDGRITTMDTVHHIERIIADDLAERGGPRGRVLILNYIVLNHE